MASLIANLIGVMVGIIIAFNVAVPSIQTSLWAANLTAGDRAIANTFITLLIVGILVLIVNISGMGG